jgi:hypothetical protein
VPHHDVIAELKKSIPNVDWEKAASEQKTSNPEWFGNANIA